LAELIKILRSAKGAKLVLDALALLADLGMMRGEEEKAF
jgi:hypothetical protein